MTDLDARLKQFFARGRKTVLSEDRVIGYPDAEEIYLFLTDALKGDRLEKLLAHLGRHPEDQELVIRLRRLMESEEALEPPRSAVAKARALMGGAPPSLKRRAANWVWLAAAAACFAASFLVERYFFQFLALALFFGFKWVIDRRALKQQILIYKALRESDKPDLHRTHTPL